MINIAVILIFPCVLMAEDIKNVVIETDYLKYVIDADGTNLRESRSPRSEQMGGHSLLRRLFATVLPVHPGCSP